MHNWPKVCCQIWPNASMARAICKTLWLRVRVQHVGSFCFRAINTFEQPQLESQTSPTVNGLCYQLCKVPTTNSNCGQLPLGRPPHLAPPLQNELLLNNCANFQFMFLLVMVATPTRQAARQAGSRYESIRLLTFVIFLFCLPFPLLLVARQTGSKVAHPPCCPVNRDRQLQTRRGNATSAAGNVWPHTRTRTHTRTRAQMHTCGNVYLIYILPFDG